LFPVARVVIQTLPGASPNSAAVTGGYSFWKCGRNQERLARPEPWVALAALPEVPDSIQTPASIGSGQILAPLRPVEPEGRLPKTPPTKQGALQIPAQSRFQVRALTGGMEHNDVTSKFIESESPTTRVLATLFCTAAFIFACPRSQLRRSTGLLAGLAGFQNP
jgi:hypothetical protein